MKLEDHEKFESFDDFIAQNIPKNKTKLDREVFIPIFREGDEISPNYKDSVLHVVTREAVRDKVRQSTFHHNEISLRRCIGKFVLKIICNKSQVAFEITQLRRL